MDGRTEIVNPLALDRAKKEGIVKTQDSSSLHPKLRLLQNNLQVPVAALVWSEVRCQRRCQSENIL